MNQFSKSVIMFVEPLLSKLQLSWDPLYLNAGEVSTNYEPNQGTYVWSYVAIKGVRYCLALFSLW